MCQIVRFTYVKMGTAVPTELTFFVSVILDSRMDRVLCNNKGFDVGLPNDFDQSPPDVMFC